MTLEQYRQKLPFTHKDRSQPGGSRQGWVLGPPATAHSPWEPGTAAAALSTASEVGASEELRRADSQKHQRKEHSRAMGSQNSGKPLWQPPFPHLEKGASCTSMACLTGSVS